MENSTYDKLSLEQCFNVLLEGLNKATLKGCYLMDEVVLLKMVYEKIKNEMDKKNEE
jgi:hypothetical protein